MALAGADLEIGEHSATHQDFGMLDEQAAEWRGEGLSIPPLRATSRTR